MSEGSTVNNIDLPHLFETSLSVPAKKLDADHYAADDIDGVTESIFGSGNLAYASLQASQTDTGIAVADAVNFVSDPVHDVAGQNFQGAAAVYPDQYTANLQTLDLAGSTDTDRAVENTDSSGPETISTEGTFAGTTVGSLGASALSFDAGSFAGGSNLDLNGDNNNIDDSAIINNSQVTNNHNDNSTHETSNNETHIINDNDTVENVVNTLDETINHYSDLTETLINNIVNLGDELIENILEGDLTEITQILTTEIHDILNILNTEIENIYETVNNLLEETHLTEIIETVTNITNDLTDNVTTIVNNFLDDVLGGGIAVNLDLGILDTLGAGLHLSIEDSIAGELNTSLVSDNLYAVVNGLTGLDIPLLSDTGAAIGFNLFGGSDPDDGKDINILGFDTPDIPLDLVEDIIGDIDINITLPEELLDPGALLAGAENLLTSVGDFSLADPAQILDIAGGQGIDGALEILLGDNELADDFNIDLESALDDAAEVLGIEDELEDLGDGLQDALGNLASGDISGIADNIFENSNDGGTDSDVTADLGIDVLGTEIIDDALDIGIDTVEDIAGDIDLGIGLGTDLLNQGGDETDNFSGDTDITINTGVDVVDNTISDLVEEVSLDPLEELTGDIDLDLNLGLDILGDAAAPVVNEGSGGTGEDTLLANIGDILGDSANSILDELAENTGEEIFTEVDNLIDDAIGLLDGGDIGGGDDLLENIIPDWTESTVGEGLFDDLLGGLGGASDPLPDPVGTVAEGLGALDVVPDLDIGSLGGLFG